MFSEAALKVKGHITASKCDQLFSSYTQPSLNAISQDQTSPTSNRF